MVSFPSFFKFMFIVFLDSEDFLDLDLKKITESEKREVEGYGCETCD